MGQCLTSISKDRKTKHPGGIKNQVIKRIEKPIDKATPEIEGLSSHKTTVFAKEKPNQAGQSDSALKKSSFYDVLQSGYKEDMELLDNCSAVTRPRIFLYKPSKKVQTISDANSHSREQQQLSDIVKKFQVSKNGNFEKALLAQQILSFSQS
jgi:hypothetical protein